MVGESCTKNLSRIKVLIYSHDWAPSVGGVETVVMVLAVGLAGWQREHVGEVVDVTLVTNTPPGDMDDSQLPFHVVRQPGLRAVARLIRETDIVHLAGPSVLPLLLSLSLRKPVIVEHHGFQVVCPNGQMFHEPTQTLCPGYYMRRRYDHCLKCNRKSRGLIGSLRLLALTPLRRWLSNEAACNVSPTQWLGTILKLRRMVPVHHGVADEGGSVLGARSTSTFVCQGRLVSTKGFDVILRAIEILGDEGTRLCVKIIGDGPQYECLVSRAARCLGDVQFLGRLGKMQLAEVLSDATAVVVPSLAGEVFGLVAAENMLRGKLVIVSDIGALREVVGGAGLVFKVGDASSLAACMRRVIADPALAVSLGAAARRRALEAFNVPQMIQAHVSLYREVLS
jgi:glycogen(starch) synthase